MGPRGQEVLVGPHAGLMDAEGLRDGGAGNVRVQDGAVVAAALHLGRHQGGDQGLAHAALAADDRDDLFDARALAQVLPEALRGALGAIFAACGAIVCTFAHVLFLPFLLIVIRGQYAL